MRRSLVAVMPKYAGLGNRLRSFMGLRALADLEGRRFAYVWPVNKYFGASMTDLWQISDTRLNAATGRFLTTTQQVYIDPTLSWLDSARPRGLWVVRNGHEVKLPPGAPAWQEQLRATAPADQVREIIESKHAEFDGQPYIGVMIRAHKHSHAETLKHSPVSWFERRMHELQEQHEGVRFYLSCDVPELKASLASRFPGTIAVQEEAAYASRRAMVLSTVDIYLLASAGYILAPHYSSFPELAGHLAGPSLPLETAVNGVTSVARLARVTDPTAPYQRHLDN